MASKQPALARPEAALMRGGGGGRPEVVPPAPRPGAAPQPSWPAVIATTVRLFAGRRINGVRQRRSRWWMIALTAMAAVAVGAVVPVLDAGRGDLAAGRRHRPAPVRVAAPDGGMVARAAAARWVAGEAGAGVVIACDPADCAALRAAGISAPNLRVLAGAAGSLGGAAVAVLAARGRAAAGLTGSGSPVVVASFGTGRARVGVWALAAGRPVPAAALRADWRARRWAGRQLASNPDVRLAGAARAALWAGLVDARLLATLAALASAGPVRVLGFADAGPNATPGVPLRAAVLTGPAGAGQASYLRGLGRLVAAQRAPYQPARVWLAREGGGQRVLVIRFAAAGPLGLLGPAAYQELGRR